MLLQRLRYASIGRATAAGNVQAVFMARAAAAPAWLRRRVFRRQRMRNARRLPRLIRILEVFEL